MRTNVQISTIVEEALDLLSEVGVPHTLIVNGTLEVHIPITGEVIGRVKTTDAADAKQAITTAHEVFLEWRKLSAPHRGELVRLLGEELQREKSALGRFVTIEASKI